MDSTDRTDEGQLASAEAPASGRPSYAEIKDKLLCGGKAVAASGGAALATGREHSERLAVWGADTARSVLGHVKDLTANLSEAVFTDVRVTVCVLPLGPDPEQYHLILDFDELVSNLRRGVLAQPRMVVYSHAVELDGKVLGEALLEEFAVQYREAVAGFQEEQNSKLAAMQTECEKHANRTKWSVVSLATGIGCILLVTNPVADIVLVSLALFDGRTVWKHFVRHMSLMKARKQTNRTVREERDKLRKDMLKGRRSLDKAISRLRIKVHPVLARLYSLMCRLDSPGPSPEHVPTADDCPDIREFLNAPPYRARLDEAYLALLDTVVE